MEVKKIGRNGTEYVLTNESGENSSIISSNEKSSTEIGTAVWFSRSRIIAVKEYLTLRAIVVPGVFGRLFTSRSMLHGLSLFSDSIQSFQIKPKTWIKNDFYQK